MTLEVTSPINAMNKALINSIPANKRIPVIVFVIKIVFLDIGIEQVKSTLFFLNI